MQIPGLCSGLATRTTTAAITGSISMKRNLSLHPIIMTKINQIIKFIYLNSLPLLHEEDVNAISSLS